jgi:hypothetical protein
LAVDLAKTEGGCFWEMCRRWGWREASKFEI